ncbi:MAG: hypothetical protein QM710_14310 [Flavobacterium sp.]
MQHEESFAVNYKGKNEKLPENDTNPYDNAGRIYEELFDSYYDGSMLPQEVPHIIERVTTIASANSSFASLSTNGFGTLSSERMQHFATQGNACIPEVLNRSSLTQNAKASFSGFIYSFISLYGTESDVTLLYNAVVKYENSVINTILLTENDKRIILTTTSIVRYSAYRTKKKPKKNTDPDWIIFVGNIVGGADGAEENMCKAIAEALATGIISNR